MTSNYNHLKFIKKHNNRIKEDIEFFIAKRKRSTGSY